jgi:hypothetical protein
MWYKKMTMAEHYDYGGVHIPASLEVAWYEVEEEQIMSVDWRQRASEHFRGVEAGQLGQHFPAAIGALSLSMSKEKVIRRRTKEISDLEAMLQYEHHGPND